MTRLDRYILSEMFVPFLSALLLILMMLIGNTLFPLIRQIVQYNVPIKVVAKLIACNIPGVLVLTLPAGVAVAASWATNRMARDSEVTAIRMSGVSLRRLFAPMIAVGVVVSLLSFWINDRVVPWAKHQFETTQSQMLAYTLIASPDIATNRVFTFGNYSFHVREIHKDPSGDPNKLRLAGIEIFQNSTSGSYASAMTAQTAEYNQGVWILHDTVIHQFDRDGWTSVEFQAKETTLNLAVPLTGLAESSFSQPEEKSMAQLGVQMRALARTGQPNNDIAFNYYLKLSLPCICAVFALCAPPLALRLARAGAYSGMLLSLIMVFIGWNTLYVTEALGLAGRLNPFVAAWAPNVLFLVIGLIALRSAE